MTETSPEPVLTAEGAIPLLQATPATLRTLLAPLPQTWIDFREESDAWSPREVLIHLIHNERTNWILRAQIILSDSAERRFPAFQQMPEPGEIGATGLATLLDQFEAVRRENLATLRSLHLTSQEYQRTGMHPVLGTVNLRQLLATWMVHDLNHTHQILKSLAKIQGDAVGPWRPNLAILNL